jgi:hypothetical protein
MTTTYELLDVQSNGQARGTLEATTFYELLDVQTIGEARATLEQLVRRLSAVEASVDPTTGAISVDPAAIAGAISDVVPLDIGGRMLAELRHIVDGGMLVTSSGRSAFPWALLTTPGGATALGAAPLRQLGLPVDGPPDLWPIEIASRFPAAPPQVATPAVGRLVSDSAAVEAALLASSAPVLSLRNTNGDGEGGGGGGGGGGAPSLGIIDQLVGCFAGAQWELNWWGVRIALDESCARAVADTLTGLSSGTVLAALKAAFTATGTLLASLGAAVAAVGGWALGIIALCAYIFGTWLKSVITSAGAYIDCTWIGPVAWGR